MFQHYIRYQCGVIVVIVVLTIIVNSNLVFLNLNIHNVMKFKYK